MSHDLSTYTDEQIVARMDAVEAANAYTARTYGLEMPGHEWCACTDEHGCEWDRVFALDAELGSREEDEEPLEEQQELDPDYLRDLAADDGF